MGCGSMRRIVKRLCEVFGRRKEGKKVKFRQYSGCVFSRYYVFKSMVLSRCVEYYPELFLQISYPFEDEPSKRFFDYVDRLKEICDRWNLDEVKIFGKLVEEVGNNVVVIISLVEYLYGVLNIKDEGKIKSVAMQKIIDILESRGFEVSDVQSFEEIKRNCENLRLVIYDVAKYILFLELLEKNGYNEIVEEFVPKLGKYLGNENVKGLKELWELFRECKFDFDVVEFLDGIYGLVVLWDEMIWRGKCGGTLDFLVL